MHVRTGTLMMASLLLKNPIFLEDGQEAESPIVIVGNGDKPQLQINDIADAKPCFILQDKSMLFITMAISNPFMTSK